MSLILVTLLAFLSVLASVPGAEPGPVKVDSSTLQGRVMCGYQAWFRCPGDDSGIGW